jgi:hypothetical protein
MPLVAAPGCSSSSIEEITWSEPFPTARLGLCWRLQVLKLADAMVAAGPKDEAEVKPLEKLIAEAFTEIDKAVGKGIIHKNNAARKKSRCSRCARGPRGTTRITLSSRSKQMRRGEEKDGRWGGEGG